MDMQPNIGKTDASIRYIVGVGLLLLLVLLDGWFKLIGLLGLFPLITAAIDWCPMYQLFGMSSRHFGGGTAGHAH